MKYPNLFAPCTIGRLKLKNRIVMAPMGTNFANTDGTVSDRNVLYYSHRARGGVGLIVVEAMYVHPSAKHRVRGMGINEDRFLPGLTRLAAAIHDGGSAAAVQLVHNGKSMSSSTTGIQLLAPSAIPHRVTGEVPREMTQRDIEEITGAFAQAARRARDAGFDAVEIHGAHGYLLQQFLSPLTNRRSDRYGGGFEGRSRFPLEVVRAVVEEVGKDIEVIYRVSYTEFLPGGIPEEEMMQFCRMLESSGVSAIHVSAGVNETPPDMAKVISPMHYPPMRFVEYSSAVKASVGIPTIAVGRINQPHLAEETLAQRKADLIALGRALIADPEWPRKAVEGRETEIRKCVACNQGCIDRLTRQLDITCIQNPYVGRPEEMGLETSDKPKRVVVLGGGPAGLEFARIARKRGHSVVLFEAKYELGGQIRAASRPPGKEGLMEVISWRVKEVRDLGVDIHLGSDCNLSPGDFDVVVVATGGKPYVPPLQIDPGLSERVKTAIDVLEGPDLDGERVVVIGGGMVGLETADYLASLGKRVSVVEALSDVGRGIGQTFKAVVLERLASHGVSIHTDTTLVRWDEQGMVLACKDGSETVLTGIDWLVVATGMAPNRPEITSATSECVLVGDAKSPGTLIDVFRSVQEAADGLG